MRFKPPPWCAENALTSADVLQWLKGTDVPGLVQALLKDLGEPLETSARLFGFNPNSEWGGIVSDVAAGKEPIAPFNVGYVVRGLVALWLLQRGGWIRYDGGVRRVDGVKITGNGTSSWASMPGRAGCLYDSTGEWGCEGPVVRHDILRLMLRVEAGEQPA